MPSIFEQRFQSRGVTALNRQHAVEVVLTDGTSTTPPFKARRNPQVYKSWSEDMGLTVSITMRDYILPIADLLFSGAQVTPRTGHRINEGSEVYQISPPDAKQPAVELLPGGYEYLVHTKRVE